MAPRFVIVGASLAGATAAATLRQEGFDGEIVLVGAEPHAPYERPALSKQFLRGEMPFDKMLVRPRGFYEEHRIEALLGVPASRVTPGDRTVELEGGRTIRYDKLLLATGARNRRPPIPGLDLPGVFTLRTAADADALREEMRPGGRAVVIGLGFIGCEVAASLRQQGMDVVGVEPSPAPLFRVLGEALAGVVAAIHRDHGVRLALGEGVAAIEGTGHVQQVVTSRGARFDCDIAVVGVGVEPEVGFLEGSGIPIDNGVVVDEHCRSSVDGIYAAGDVANHYHPSWQRRMRVEHWQNALHQGAAAARSMLGRPEPYDPVHWFWSDQYDCNVQYAGVHLPGDRLVLRGRLDQREFVAFYVGDGRLNAAVSFNRAKDLRRVMPLIKARARVDAARLEDEGVDLRSLAPAAASRG